MDRFALGCFFSLVFAVYCIDAAIVSYDGRAITINGQRRVLISGSIHYPRSTPDMWPSLIRKAKEGGLNAVETYVFWNAHEPLRRQYDFSGNLDLIRFIKTIQAEGLYAVLRIGPYVCAEWNYGGLPVWLHNMPNVEFRTANTVFMNEMQNFTTLIVDMAKNENLFATQGGPIILAQIENEYGNVMSSYGLPGKAYLEWCADMAESLQIGVPWIMCQQTDAPPPIINTCNGFYCHDFTPNSPNSPKMWTENWTGWFKNWGGKHPKRTAQDVAYAVAKFYQTGGTFQNYYMYHGGTNFARTAGGPYITTSYDYDAPLDEFGIPNQPKWGHLKKLHHVLYSMEKTLTHGNVSTVDLGNSVTATIYETNEESSCFLSNSNTTADATVMFRGNQYSIPAWSVSLLPNCQKEAYNTAKLNTQTSVMVKRADYAEDAPVTLQWSWRPEVMRRTVLEGKGDIELDGLFDQKRVTNDTSDYLWYMTRAHLDKNDPIWGGSNMTLRIHTSGHVLHTFVNGEYLGSEWPVDGKYDYVSEKNIKLAQGDNRIALLSATVGLQNYGAFFDQKPVGVRGPVEIISRSGDERVVKDLSSQKWSYKVGFDGFDSKLYSDESLEWSAQDVPSNRMMTWYKTSFKTPLGTDPVVVELKGLNKGVFWVNGVNLGRYWPSLLASDDGCSAEPCDYRGPYDSNKCANKCDKPTQKWYHVPRCFLNENGTNTLTIFEELGGDPSNVNVKTVVVGTACGHGYEHHTLQLSCHGHPISAIKFASFGDPEGQCGSYAVGSCSGNADPVALLEKECVGKETCSVEVSIEKFGPTTCGNGVAKRLVVEAAC